MSPTFISGYIENRSEITSKCCLANTIVGARTIACFPAETTQKMARNATSVLPKPTSPQINRSIGVSLSVKSFPTSMKACYEENNLRMEGTESIHFCTFQNFLIYYSITTQEDFSFNVSTKTGKKLIIT